MYVCLCAYIHINTCIVGWIGWDSMVWGGWCTWDIRLVGGETSYIWTGVCAWIFVGVWGSIYTSMCGYTDS